MLPSNPKTTVLFVKCMKRLKVPENCFWEAIRRFLKNVGNNWYQSTVTSHKTAPWEQWRNLFLDAFTQKVWASACEAFQYQFHDGLLADYALKKLNLLVAFNPKMVLCH